MINCYKKKWDEIDISDYYGCSIEAYMALREDNLKLLTTCVNGVYSIFIEWKCSRKIEIATMGYHPIFSVPCLSVCLICMLKWNSPITNKNCFFSGNLCHFHAKMRALNILDLGFVTFFALIKKTNLQ